MGYFFWILGLAFLVLCGRFFLLGLSPDAALYAGLSYKIHLTREYWRLSGTENFFPRFFEHPPYVFQWGSLLFDFFPSVDGVARWIGALPSFLGLAILLRYFYKKSEAAIGILTVLLLLVTGHFTKYAATSLLEGPLFLGVVLVFLASLDFRNQNLSWKSVGIGFLGAFICTASKGVAGLGAATAFFVIVFIHFSSDKSFKKLFLALGVGVAFLLPLSLWAYMTYSPYAEDWYFLRYWNEQVLKSATTNRGNLAHSREGSRLYYFIVVIKNLPHLFVLSLLCVTWLYVKKEGFRYFERILIRNSFIFFLAYFIPFSWVRFQLPHYLHPVYFALAIPAAIFLNQFVQRIRPQAFSKVFQINFQVALWCFLLGGGVLFVQSQQGVSKSANRGQEFMVVKDEVNLHTEAARLWLSRQTMDPYRMEAFSLWYFKGRKWSYLENQNASHRPTHGDLLWDPPHGRLSYFK